MAINRSTQQRQNYGLGSFVKKAFNKVTRPFTKVARKIVPKEIAGIARTAAPFVAGMGRPGLGALISALGQAKQKGRINPFETALSAAPGFAYGKGAYFGDEKKGFLDNLGIGSLKNAGTTAGGSSLRNILTGGGVGQRDLGSGLLGERFGTSLDESLYGKDFRTNITKGMQRGDITEAEGKLKIANLAEELGKGNRYSSGLLGKSGDYDLLDNKIVDFAIKKDQEKIVDGVKIKTGKKELSYLKLAGWTMSVYSGIEAGKYNDELEAAAAAEAAAEADGATDSEVQASIDWAKATFGRLSRADIGLAQGGRVNYAAGGGYNPEDFPLGDPTAPIGVPPEYKPKPAGPVLPDKMMAEFDIGEYFELFEKANPQFKGMNRDSDDYKFYFEDYWRGLANKKQEGNTMMAANGGLMRTNYALGTKPEPKESGLGGLPIEADMRYSGGFMPYGKKEKADDVPARLSKNEFVFTADAVKAAGGGSMNEGARKMYQTMKMLEQQNRMMS